MSTSLSQPHRNAVLDGIERERLERADLAQRDELVAGIARRMVAVERPPAALPVKKPVASVTQEQAQAALRQQVVARIGAVGRNRERRQTRVHLQPLGFPCWVQGEKMLCAVRVHYVLSNPREHECDTFWFPSVQRAQEAFPRARLLALPDYPSPAAQPVGPDLRPKAEDGSVLPGLRVVDNRGVELLTPCEDRVVRLVADGRSNPDIARDLGLSEHTVKTYIHRVFDKLGVSNRVELTLYAINHSAQAAAEPGGAA